MDGKFDLQVKTATRHSSGGAARQAQWFVVARSAVNYEAARYRMDQILLRATAGRRRYIIGDRHLRFAATIRPADEDPAKLASPGRRPVRALSAGIAYWHHSIQMKSLNLTRQ